MDQIEKISTQEEVVIFSKSSCCMCHSIKKLLYYLGASPLVLELDEEDFWGKKIEKALVDLGCNPAVPAVFIGGKLVGSASTLMGLHLKGSLMNMLAPK